MGGTEYKPALPDVLRAILDFDGIDARKLAERMGRNEGVIGKWVRGEARPAFESMVQLADALDAPVDILVRPPATRYLLFLQMLAHRGVLRADEAERAHGDEPPRRRADT